MSSAEAAAYAVECSKCGQCYDIRGPEHKCKTNDAGEVTSTSIDDTLAERGTRYGTFTSHADISCNLKNTLTDTDSWSSLKPYQREALEMICHKMARIVNGDPDYDDSWRDIAGYSQLVVDILNGKDT